MQNLLLDNQYTFRTEHSTKFAAIELTDRIIAQMDKNEIPMST